MSTRLLNTLKVWAGLIGCAATAASAAAELPVWVTVIGVVATAVAIYQVPGDRTVIARIDARGLYRAGPAAFTQTGSVIAHNKTLEEA